MACPPVDTKKSSIASVRHDGSLCLLTDRYWHGNNTGEVLVQSSKYIVRMLDAATNFEKQAGVQLPSDTAKFFDVAKKLLEIRKNNGSREEAEELGRSIGIHTAADLESKLASLATTVNTNARATGAGGSS